MSDDRTVQELKNESRIIQQKIHEMDLKLVKLHDIEEKINRIEALLNDKLGQIHRCTDTTMENTDKLRNELANMKEQINSNPYKL